MIFYLLYHRVNGSRASLDQPPPARPAKVAFYPDFADAADHFLHVPGVTLPGEEPTHLFALFYQVRRAFYHIFEYIIGRSAPAARSAPVWQSICTHDARRYRRFLYDRMGDLTDPHHRPQRHRQGTRRPRHRPVALRPVRRQDPDVRR